MFRFVPLDFLVAGLSVSSCNDLHHAPALLVHASLERIRFMPLHMGHFTTRDFLGVGSFGSLWGAKNLQGREPSGSR